jgi:hypothetical protein
MSIESDNLLIKQTLSSQGWLLIEQMLKDKITEVTLAKNVNKNKRYEDIAIDTLGKLEAAKKIHSVLKKLDQIKNKTEVKKQVYI